ncbi:hypothetical protein L6452_47017 [Arctium lappa]|nr:hypothetical protein L6452_47017 [Arctium lappa]
MPMVEIRVGTLVGIRERPLILVGSLLILVRSTLVAQAQLATIRAYDMVMRIIAIVGLKRGIPSKRESSARVDYNPVNHRVLNASCAEAIRPRARLPGRHASRRPRPRLPSGDACRLGRRLVSRAHGAVGLKGVPFDGRTASGGCQGLRIEPCGRKGSALQ